MQTLNLLLKDYPLTDFLNTHFTRRPFSMPDTAQAFSHLLNWDVVERVMAEKKSVLRIVKDGVLAHDHAQINFDDAQKFYSHGHTLLLRYAEKSHPLLSDLALDFSKSFRTEVDIQLYCTPAGNNAFGWHYDVEEVFIIQTKGSKLYTIRPNSIHPNPLLSSIPYDLKYETEKSELQLQVLLQEGDWLYIPSGWWHIARTQAESMHISVGLMPRSAVDIIHFLTHYLVKYPHWRTRFPVHKDLSEDDESHVYEEAFSKLGQDLQNILQTKEFVGEFLKFSKNKFL